MTIYFEGCSMAGIMLIYSIAPRISQLNNTSVKLANKGENAVGQRLTSEAEGKSMGRLSVLPKQWQFFVAPVLIPTPGTW